MLRVKHDFFLQSHLEYFCLPSLFRSHSLSDSRVSKVSEIIVLTFFMMSKAGWTADKSIVFFGKRRIVIKLSVKLVMIQKLYIAGLQGF